MKFLLVFVSALVLVAHGKAAPSKDEERVNLVQSEVAAGYSADEAGQEDGVGPQGAFAEEVPAVYKPKVADRYFYDTPESVYIPMISRACTNSSCLYICNLLGFPKGTCVSATTCQCSS